MDPQSTAHLDPKLRETYERVMGAAHAASGTTPPQPQTDYSALSQTAAPAAVPPTPSETPDTQIAGQPLPDFPQDANNADNLRFQAAIQTPPGAAAAPAPEEQPASVPHQAPAYLRVLYIVGAIVFFIVYTFFWIKVFNLPLPF